MEMNEVKKPIIKRKASFEKLYKDELDKAKKEFEEKNDELFDYAKSITGFDFKAKPDKSIFSNDFWGELWTLKLYQNKFLIMEP